MDSAIFIAKDGSFLDRVPVVVQPAFGLVGERIAGIAECGEIRIAEAIAAARRYWRKK